MSLFIKIDRFASQPRLFRLRALASTFGEDNHGVLTLRRPNQAILGFFRFGERFLMVPSREGVKHNNRQLEVGESLVLSDGLKVTWQDYTFAFFLTSTRAEILAHAAAPIENLEDASDLAADWPILRVSLAQIEARFPLIPGIPIAIGRHEDNPICLDLEGIARHHCNVTFISNETSENAGNQPEVNIESVEGEVLIRSQQDASTSACSSISAPGSYDQQLSPAGSLKNGQLVIPGEMILLPIRLPLVIEMGS